MIKPLHELVEDVGQVKAAEMLGVHQTAISKAVRTKRKIYVKQEPNGSWSATEEKPFPSQKAKPEVA